MRSIDALGNPSTYTYDPNGNLLSLTDARGNTTRSTYDAMDRIATRTDPLGRVQRFRYDPNGNLLSQTDRKGQVPSFRYDALDQMIFLGFGTTGDSANPSYQSTISASYDGVGRLTHLVDSDSGTIAYSYDGLDRLVSETPPLRYRHHRLRTNRQKHGTLGSRRRLRKRAGPERRFATPTNQVIAKRLVSAAQRGFPRSG
ncbi:MAG TPA: hypothetical protein VFZ66_02780 [Herpetosiphonaceae bacterium]